MTDVGSRLETKPVFVQDLIDDVRSGEIKVPKFQRRFVWRGKQAIALLDSVGSNYPIGSLLFWRTHDKLCSERNIGDFRLPDTEEMVPTNYVLDGQQRLTVLYSCLGAERKDSGFEAGYDLEKERFIDITSADPKLSIVPLRNIFKTTELLDYRSSLRAHAEHRLYQERVDALVKVLSKYKIPVVILKDLTVEEVCPIFERINSSGTRLSTYDLMVAATWNEQFDLNDKSEEIAESLGAKRFADIEKTTVLKCLAAIQLDSVKREDILRLRKLELDPMNQLVSTTKGALLRAVDTLSTEFGIYSWDFLPYEALVIILARVYSRAGSLTSEQVRRSRQWFWRSAFSERYRGASEFYISRDLRSASDWIITGAGSDDDWGEPPAASLIERVVFRSNNSRSRAFVLALASLKPRNLTNGSVIDTADALSSFNRKQFHHIFPRAHLKRIRAPGEHNALANICMLAASENNRISDEDASIYLPTCAEDLGPDAIAIFESNLLMSPSRINYNDLDYEDFLLLRAEKIERLMRDLCEGLSIKG